MARAVSISDLMCSKDYVFNGLIDAADWLTRALDVQGYRLDDVKGLSTDFLFPFLTSKSMAAVDPSRIRQKARLSRLWKRPSGLGIINRA